VIDAGGILQYGQLGSDSEGAGGARQIPHRIRCAQVAPLPCHGPPNRQRPVRSLSYGRYTITPRTFQIRGSGQWTLDLLIAHRDKVRAFSGPATFPTEQAAIRGCHAFGRRIIEGRVPNLSVDDLR
jgi:hypothetical protein